MSTGLQTTDTRIAALIVKRRASLDATGQWEAPFAVHMLLHCIEQDDRTALAHWVSRIERDDAHYTAEEKLEYYWLHQAAAVLLSRPWLTIGSSASNIEIA